MYDKIHLTNILFCFHSHFLHLQPSVCFFVSLLAYPKNHVAKLRQIFSAYRLIWPWFRPLASTHRGLLGCVHQGQSLLSTTALLLLPSVSWLPLISESWRRSCFPGDRVESVDCSGCGRESATG